MKLNKLNIFLTICAAPALLFLLVFAWPMGLLVHLLSSRDDINDIVLACAITSFQIAYLFGLVAIMETFL